MSGSNLGIKLKIQRKVEKYSNIWSQEDINSGVATPYEVINDIEEIDATPEVIEALGTDDETLKQLIENAKKIEGVDSNGSY